MSCHACGRQRNVSPQSSLLLEFCFSKGSTATYLTSFSRCFAVLKSKQHKRYTISWPTFLGSWMHEEICFLKPLTHITACYQYFFSFAFESLFGHGLDSWKCCGCCWFKFSFSFLFISCGWKSLSFLLRKKKRMSCEGFWRHTSRGLVDDETLWVFNS